MTPSNDAQASFWEPFSAEDTAYRLDVTTTSASINLTKGTYNIHYSSGPSAIVLIRLGATAVLPASANATGQPGFWPTPNNPYRILIESATTLNAITVSGTAVLWITKVD